AVTINVVPWFIVRTEGTTVISTGTRAPQERTSPLSEQENRRLTPPPHPDSAPPPTLPVPGRSLPSDSSLRSSTGWMSKRLLSVLASASHKGQDGEPWSRSES